MKNRNAILIIALVIMTITAGGASFIFIDNLLKPPGEEGNVSTEEQGEDIPVGTDFLQITKEQWLNLPRERTLAVIIDNDINSRPQAGLNEGDIIYEFPVEGGRSRFMAIYSRFNPQLIGPIRSARDYNIQIAQEYESIFVHGGGSPQAFELLNSIDNLNGLAGGVDRAFWRIKDREEPYNLYSNPQSLRRVAFQEGFMEQPKTADFDYLDQGENFPGERAESILIEYGDKEYSIQYQFDKNSSRYLRNTAGAKHLDDQGRQLAAKNLIVQIVRTDLLDEEGRLKIDLEGPGKALFFVDGQVMQGKWKRDQGETHYYNGHGEEIALRPGNTWIHIVPSQRPITYQ